ncbi:hypothetical protein CHLRE_10g460326v5 [Chlamydomonas reinhardtii]|uniref:Uncharacterized protein n=1 Tax=Chlamydomonas reinhardtii TaxID=3055 RepID=A8I139_CHLRE|nr:uncharacterized protein CHLRE_10g460326v5 [Chlamydomonas reinhardtii]PNW78001.1 hypothetical protein CHLRE_10g460326v5 [Chlamydomonas reinhardtii]|eukprot:XP_001698596.1 predicted protein [Chlamydomonas reinhardtii]
MSGMRVLLFILLLAAAAALDSSPAQLLFGACGACVFASMSTEAPAMPPPASSLVRSTSAEEAVLLKAWNAAEALASADLSQ